MIEIIDTLELKVPENLVKNYEQKIEKALTGLSINCIDPKLLVDDKQIEYFILALEDIVEKGKPYTETLYYRFILDVFTKGLYVGDTEVVMSRFLSLYENINSIKKVLVPVIVFCVDETFITRDGERLGDPIKVKAQADYRIISGRHRVAIATYLGLKQIPTYILKDNIFSYPNQPDRGRSLILPYWRYMIERNEERYIKELSEVYTGQADYKYHSNRNIEKEKIVIDVIVKIRPKTLVDIGCNTGMLSSGFTKAGVEVTGVDIVDKERLNLPEDYNFIKQDITKKKFDIKADVILFLSVYHHLVYNVGVEKADEIFYDVFKCAKYLIFDAGNPEEKKTVYRQHWITKLNKYFKTEKELLDHFGLGYEILGKWGTGGAFRSIVMFKHQ